MKAWMLQWAFGLLYIQAYMLGRKFCMDGHTHSQRFRPAILAQNLGVWMKQITFVSCSPISGRGEGITGSQRPYRMTTRSWLLETQHREPMSGNRWRFSPWPIPIDSEPLHIIRFTQYLDYRTQVQHKSHLCQHWTCMPTYMIYIYIHIQGDFFHWYPP